MDAQSLTIDDLRSRERRLEDCAARRNRFEYVAGGLAAALLTAAGAITLTRAETLGATVGGIGHLAVAAATLWVLARLRRLQRAARSATPGLPILAHLRARLVAERDMLRDAWRWYVAPLVPGFALVYGGIALEPEPNWTVFWTGSLVTALVIGTIAWLNRRAADRIAQQIDRLDEGDAAR